MPTLALIDGNSVAYRAFYALPEDLATKSGQVTNAVFGFTRMLIRLLKDYHPDGIAVAWDVSRQTFRTESYPAYKAQREKAPDHFRSQLPLMDEVLQTLNITQLREEGYEADDIIATLTRNGVSAGWEVLIVTGDRDAFQLIEGPVKVVYTRRGISDIVLADEGYVEEKYGIRPDQYVEYAALRGDTSDNLPGVPGVGEKTASRLIADHGDLDNLFLSVTELTPKLRENLSAHREQVFLNRELMRLIDDMDLGVEIEELRTREWDRNQVKDLFDSLEFHSMWNDLELALPSAATESELVEVESSLVTSPDQVAAMAKEPVLVAGLVSDGGEPFGLAISTGPGEAAVVPFDSAGALLDALESGQAALAGHDVKDLVRVLLELDRDVDRLAMDTALAAYIVNPSQRTYDLEELADRLLGLELVSPDDDAAALGTLPFDSGPDLETEGRRIEGVRRLVEVMRAELSDREEGELFEEFELPLIPVLARMEHAGIAVDRPYLEDMGADLREKLTALDARIQDAGGGAVQRQFHRSAPLCPLREVGTAGDQEDLDRQAIHRRLRIEEAGSPGRRCPPRVQGVREAPGDVCRWLSPLGRRRWPHQDPVQSDGGDDGAIVLGPPQSAEHPDTVRVGSHNPPCVHRRGGSRVPRRRLLPDRVAGAGSHERGPVPRGGLPLRLRHPHCHRGSGLGLVRV